MNRYIIEGYTEFKHIYDTVNCKYIVPTATDILNELNKLSGEINVLCEKNTELIDRNVELASILAVVSQNKDVKEDIIDLKQESMKRYMLVDSNGDTFIHDKYTGTKLASINIKDIVVIEELNKLNDQVVMADKYSKDLNSILVAKAELVNHLNVELATIKRNDEEKYQNILKLQSDINEYKNLNIKDSSLIFDLKKQIETKNSIIIKLSDQIGEINKNSIESDSIVNTGLETSQCIESKEYDKQFVTDKRIMVTLVASRFIKGYSIIDRKFIVDEAICIVNEILSKLGNETNDLVTSSKDKLIKLLNKQKSKHSIELDSGNFKEMLKEDFPG